MTRSPDCGQFTVWTAPILRWAGSKRKLLPTLTRCIPAYRGRYFEPFAGSACLFFAVRPARAVLGDINAQLLETYGAIRDHPRLVHRAVSSIPDTRDEYYRLRCCPPESLSLVGRAARFVYLNRFCFNGVYRTNRNGAFNVPRGIHTGAVPGENLFYRCSVALRSACLRPGDFQACLSDVQRGDFVYLDPPYAGVSTKFSGEYGYESFSANDLDRLMLSLDQIDRAGGIFLCSYWESPMLSTRYLQWHAARLRVRRDVAGLARSRGTVTEILISNCGLPAMPELAADLVK